MCGIYRRLRPVHTTGVPGRSPCVWVWAARAGIGYRVRAVCGWGASWLLGIPCEGGRRVTLRGRGAWRTFPFCASPCTRARGPTTAAFVAIVSPAASRLTDGS